MEHLTKTQLVLLALLISFVASIATGIVTVTLMQQAPQGVTQTINNVVERTIEKVIPVKGPNLTETKIIKEEDFIVAAVENNKNSVVKITISADPAGGVSGGEVGSGVILSGDGYIATDSSGVVVMDEVYYAETTDGQILQLSRMIDRKGFVVFKVVAREKSPAPKLIPVTLADSDRVKVGQSTISLGESAAVGIISSISYDKPSENSTTTPNILSVIHTSTNAKDNLGSVVLDLDGKAIGIVGIRGGIRATIPANSLRDAVSEAQKKK